MRYPEVGEKMKFNLKNRPKTVFKDSSFTKWFEAFEKELREYRKQLWKQYQLLSIPSVEGPKLRRVIDFIDKEILGE